VSGAGRKTTDTPSSEAAAGGREVERLPSA
jgi:hypothetical protein